VEREEIPGGVMRGGWAKLDSQRVSETYYR
jgi:hypothetical protein